MKDSPVRDRSDRGFTLIELMVVVLILGILMAIAIPTFLSLTSSAKANAAESNLATALLTETTNYTSTGQFVDNAGLAQLEPNIPTTKSYPELSAPDQIFAYPGTNIDGNKDSVALVSSDAKQCYFIYDVTIPITPSRPAGTYYAFGPADGNGICSNYSFPNGPPTAGHANTGTALTWYTSF